MLAIKFTDYSSLLSEKPVIKAVNVPKAILTVVSF
jgi:hypothetical protein